MSKFTVAKIRSLKNPGRYPDGDTLYVNVAKQGSKSWIQRLTIRGRRCELGLGGWPLVSLADAREQAQANRRLARAGGDPLAQKRKGKVPTFRDAAKAHFADKYSHPPSSHARAWWQSLENHVFEHFGSWRVDSIEPAHVLALLEVLRKRHPSTAWRMRGRIRSVFGWCHLRGYVKINVAGDVIKEGLPDKKPVETSHKAIGHRQMVLSIVVSALVTPLPRSVCTSSSSSSLRCADTRPGRLCGTTSTSRRASGKFLRFGPRLDVSHMFSRFRRLRLTS